LAGQRTAGSDVRTGLEAERSWSSSSELEEEKVASLSPTAGDRMSGECLSRLVDRLW